MGQPTISPTVSPQRKRTSPRAPCAASPPPPSGAPPLQRSERGGEWEQAGELFRGAGDQIFAYQPQRSAAAPAHRRKQPLPTNDYDVARRRAELAVANGDRDEERAQIVLATLPVGDRRARRGL